MAECLRFAYMGRTDVPPCGVCPVCLNGADENPAPPKVRAPRRDWVDWAVNSGSDRDDAEAMSKRQLIETFGG